MKGGKLSTHVFPIFGSFYDVNNSSFSRNKKRSEEEKSGKKVLVRSREMQGKNLDLINKTFQLRESQAEGGAP